MLFLRTIYLFIAYPLVFAWTTICGFTGMIIAWVFQSPQLTLRLVPGKMWAPVILFLLGIKLKVQGRENANKLGPSIYVANHSSFLDIPACVSAIPVNLNFIAKKELKKMPVVGWYISATKQIFIDRKNKQLAMQSMEVAAQRIAGGRSVLSYAEGTRSKNGEVQLFRRGAFIIAENANIPITPVAVSGAFECLKPKGLFTKSGTITVTIGEPFRPSDVEFSSIEALAEIARQKVIKLKLGEA
jgi:1-acyl-sn-glycerol-3-phosphate acyltransferase